MTSSDVRLDDKRRVTWGFADHEHPVFAPDGKRLAYYAGAYGWIQLHLCGADGLGARPLTCARGNHTQPAWSPDGRHVYYRHQPAPDAPWSIWRVAADDPADKACLLHDRKTSFKHPSVSPDGRWLAWFSDHGSPGNFHLWKARLAGARLAAPRRLTGDRNRNDCHPTWSPDGRSLVFHAYMGAHEATTSHIFVCGADGEGVRRLTTTEAFHKHPFFVGRGLVVHHSEGPDGRRGLTLRRFDDGAAIGRLTSGKHNDKHPSPWVPARGPARICFASKRRGDAHEAEPDDSYDVFWGLLRGVAVRR